MLRLLATSLLVGFVFLMTFMVTTAAFDLLCRQTNYYEDGFTHE